MVSDYIPLYQRQKARVEGEGKTGLFESGSSTIVLAPNGH